MKKLSWSVLMAVGVASSCVSGPGDSNDSGTRDSGSVFDAGRADSGTGGDAGGATDSGLSIDAGGGSDAGAGLDASVAVDSGTAADAGAVDAGPFDAGCLSLETVDGGCVALLFSNVCLVPRLTVLLDKQPEDDDAGLTMASAIQANCPAPIPSRSVDAIDPSVLDTEGAPQSTHDDVYVCGGGSFGQLHVAWLETNGVSPVYDSSTATVASMSTRDGGFVFSDAVANLGPSRDYFLLELMRSKPGGPVSVVGYGMFAGGTAAAAWYLQNRVMPQYMSFSETWYVIRWTDVDADLLPGSADMFELIASGH